MRVWLAMSLAIVMGCASRTRLPLPLPPTTLSATDGTAFRSPPDPQPVTRLPEAPEIVTHVLPNGMQLIFVSRTTLPTVAVRYACRASGDQDRDLRPGVDELLERVLAQQGHLGSPSLRGSAEPGVSVFSSGVEITAQGSNTCLGAMIDTIATMVRAPGYTIDVLAPLRHVMLETIAGASTGSSYMLGVHEREMIFGPNDPRAGVWWGSAPEFGRIHPEDLQARHVQLFVPAQSAIVIVGDASVDDVERLVRDAFGDWSSPASPTRHLGAAAFPTPHARLHAIPAGGDESSLRLREHAPSRADPDRPAFEVVTALLGGMFSARINRVLREEQGHTYGIHARLTDERAFSMLSIELTVPSTHIRSSVMMMIEELARVTHAEQIESDELATARASALAEYRNRFLTIDAIAGTLAGLFLRDQTMDALLARARAIQTVTAEDVARVARHWIRVEAAPLLVIGSYRDLAGELHDVPGGSELVVWRW